jgi:aspartate carbamoyltransferase regulatory subunit
MSRRNFSIRNKQSLIRNQNSSALSNPKIGNIFNLKNDRIRADSGMSIHSKTNSSNSDVLGIGNDSQEEQELADLSNIKLPNFDSAK